ncbi:hypothetical protein DBX26_08815 [Vibrio sp. dhg]|nr:hypothetical protein DBX26_08815 [Vibrio sp. dhg]
MPRYSYASITGLASIVFVEQVALLSFIFINTLYKQLSDG